MPPFGTVASVEMLRLIFAQMDEGVAVVSPAGAILHANPAAGRMLGLSDDEFSRRRSGDPRFAVVGEDGEPMPADELPTTYSLRTKTSVPHAIMGVLGADGGRVWLRVRTQWLEGHTLLLVIFTDVTEQRRTARALADSELRLRTLFERSSIAMFRASATGQLQMVNPAWYALLGDGIPEDLDAAWRLAVHPDDANKLLTAFESAIVEKAQSTSRWRMVRTDGTVRRVEGTVMPLVSADGEFQGFVGNIVDVTARIEAEAQRDTLFDVATDIFVVVDSHGVVRRANPALSRVLGWDHEAVVGAKVWEFINVEDSGQVRDDPATLAAHPVDVRVRDKEGNWVWLSVASVAPSEHDGLHYVTARNVTARKHREEALAQRAERDPLTGVANRAAFVAAAQLAIDEASRHAPIAVVFLDLDGFKAVNDMHGHAVGDRVLAEVAQRLAAGVRRGDVVGRLGGDEFTVLLRGGGSAQVEHAVADKLAALVAGAYVVDAKQVVIGASVGVAVAYDDTLDAEALIAKADAKMYTSKRATQRATGR